MHQYQDIYILISFAIKLIIKPLKGDVVMFFKFLSGWTATVLVVAVLVTQHRSHRKAVEENYQLRQEMALYSTNELQGHFIGKGLVWEFTGDTLLQFRDGELVTVSKIFVGRDNKVTLKPVYDLTGKDVVNGETTVHIHRIGMGLVYTTHSESGILQEL